MPLRGTRAVVVGRSDIVGKPMALLLLQNDATVTVAHSKTRDLPALCREADLLVAAIGRPGFVTGEFVKEGAVVVDVGINRVTTRDDLERFFPGDAKRARRVRKERLDARRRLRPRDGVPEGLPLHARPGRRRPADDRASPPQHAPALRGSARMILKVGLTGGLASGKSTIAEGLEKRGIPVRDADRMVHELYAPGAAGARAVAAAFGKEFLAADGSVDRPKLSMHVFHDARHSPG